MDNELSNYTNPQRVLTFSDLRHIFKPKLKLIALPVRLLFCYPASLIISVINTTWKYLHLIQFIFFRKEPFIAIHSPFTPLQRVFETRKNGKSQRKRSRISLKFDDSHRLLRNILRKANKIKTQFFVIKIIAVSCVFVQPAAQAKPWLAFHMNLKFSFSSRFRFSCLMNKAGIPNVSI